MRQHDLAQFNIARMVASSDSADMADFMNALDEINALADESPGFVWRFQTEDGNATSERPYEDDMVLINLGTWSSVEALSDYVYRTAHAKYLRRRREWFERMNEPMIVLWWVPAGHRPSVEEGVERLEHLRQHGPSAHAFSFRHRYEPSEPSGD